MPTQSKATNTTGACLSACKIIPRAVSGSFTPVAGGTSPSHNGDPGGGVTSTLNVATRRSTAKTLPAANTMHSAQQLANPQSEIRNPKFRNPIIFPLPATPPPASRNQLSSSSTFYRQLFPIPPASATSPCYGCRRYPLAGWSSLYYPVHG